MIQAVARSGEAAPKRRVTSAMAPVTRSVSPPGFWQDAPKWIFVMIGLAVAATLTTVAVYLLDLLPRAAR